MKAVIQRVKSASVRVGHETKGQIGPGLVVLLGVGEEDTQDDLVYLLDKLPSLRIFPDESGKMNLSLTDTGGAALVVSQFTLYADTSRGRRPGYSRAAKPDKAKAFYDDFLDGLRRKGIPTESGVFQAHMEVELINDGPVTIILESKT
ncbi:MAG: D-aminoacyl-tRNA deacylase [Clostridiales bacterium]|nr:D-aminoacyl-tRNA deacylase [Clostridiales bacterium]